MAEPNKHDGVFTGGTQTITRPDPAGIGPNDPRPEEGAVTGMASSPGWSSNPNVPTPRPGFPDDTDLGPEDVSITPVRNPSWRDV